ncbi:uncharacterized protein [Prorops nasuta]|uniref:uncharacterized protein n=1 Tax=Prorops nasuta TaxID=863751 RepID=UPI0034CE64E6
MDIVETSESETENQQENKKPVGGSKFSEFYEINISSQNPFAVCKLCENRQKKHIEIKMKNRNTSGLKKHLLSLHKPEYAKLFPQKTSSGLRNYFKPTGSSKEVEVKDITTATIDWVIKKYLPFSFFDDAETQAFFHLISPNTQFPRRFALRNQVKQRFEELQKLVANKLQKCTSKLSFTIDGWTSIASRSFYGITGHFIDEDWNYQSIVLDFVPSHGRHTGKDIAELFSKSLKDFGIINKVIGITTDNASAITTFFYELNNIHPEIDAEDRHFRCMAHILNLGVQELMRNLKWENESNGEEEIYSDTEETNEDLTQEYNDSTSALMKLRTIFSKIKRSEILCNKFRSACETAGVPTTIKPILDCVTRWNSTHDMLGAAITLKGGIITLCQNISELSNFQISSEEWIIFEKVHKFLINFKILSTKLGGEQYVTLPLVIVSFNLLIDKIEATTKQLNDKKDRNNIDEALIFAFQACRDKMLKHYQKLTSVAEDYVTSADIADEDIIDFDKLYSAPSTSKSFTSPTSELEEYLQEPRASSDVDVLTWWKQNHTKFPILSKMARDFLTIPATSVPAERLFSKASLTRKTLTTRPRPIPRPVISLQYQEQECAYKNKTNTNI